MRRCGGDCFPLSNGQKYSQQLQAHNWKENPQDLHGKNLTGRNLVIYHEKSRDIDEAMQPLPTARAQPADSAVETGYRQEEENNKGDQSREDERFLYVGRKCSESAFIRKWAVTCSRT